MVRLNVSHAGSGEEFIFETVTSTTLEDITREVAAIHNARRQARRLAQHLSALAQHGPAKKVEAQGLTPDQIEEAAAASATPTTLEEKKTTNNTQGGGDEPTRNPDPLGKRTGQQPAASLVSTLQACAADLDAAVDPTQAKRRQGHDANKLNTALQNAKGAVMMAYPMGLPTYDPVYAILFADEEKGQAKEDLQGHEESKHIMLPETCVLWFAGKRLDRTEKLNKYIGTNEKCMIKVKLTHAKQGAPQREPAVDEETRRKMMALWHKKQEQAKQLAEDEDVVNSSAYMNAEWANPHAYKRNAMGMGTIRFR